MRFKFHRTRAGQVAGFLVGRGLLLGLELAGLRLGRALGRVLGRLVGWLDAKHRRQAVDNIVQAGIVSGRGEAQELAYRMYEHIGMSLAEIAVTGRLLRRGRLDRLVKFGGLENISTALARGRGAILAVAHLGNWETAGIAFCRYHRPIFSIVRPLDNPLLDRYLERWRERTGQRVIPKWHAAGRMRQVLLANHLLGVLMDQDAGHDGVFVDFFGRPASTVRSVGILSLRYGSPVLPLNIYREEGVIHMVFDPPVWPEDISPGPDRVARMTQLLTRKLEEFIRRHPDQWFWMHRRWKTRPPSDRGVQTPVRVRTVSG